MARPTRAMADSRMPPRRSPPWRKVVCARNAGRRHRLNRVRQGRPRDYRALRGDFARSGDAAGVEDDRQVEAQGPSARVHAALRSSLTAESCTAWILHTYSRGCLRANPCPTIPPTMAYSLLVLRGRQHVQGVAMKRDQGPFLRRNRFRGCSGSREDTSRVRADHDREDEVRGTRLSPSTASSDRSSSTVGSSGSPSSGTPSLRSRCSDSVLEPSGYSPRRRHRRRA